MNRSAYVSDSLTLEAYVGENHFDAEDLAGGFSYVAECGLAVVYNVEHWGSNILTSWTKTFNLLGIAVEAMSP